MVRLTRFRGEIRVDGATRPLLLGLVRELTGWSQNKSRELVTAGKVYVDGQPALQPFQPVNPGALVSVDTDRKRPSRIVRLEPSQVLFQDEVLVVVEKPSGLASVPPTRTGEPTLLDQLSQLLDGSGPRLSPVHRLDSGTSGVMVFGRQGPFLDELAQQFRRHSVDRRYLAVVHGDMNDQILEGRIDVSRTRFTEQRQDRFSVTEVLKLRSAPGLTLVECRPHTGRFHQIRIQLSQAGYPLVGDREHGNASLDKGLSRRLALHACFLGLKHPATARWMEWSSPLPVELEQLLAG